MSNHRRTSETYRRQDDPFEYVLQLSYCLESCQHFQIRVITSYREDCLMCSAHSTKSSKVTQNIFLALGGLHEDTLFDTLGGMVSASVKTLSSNLLTPYREQPRSTRILTAYPRPALSATKRTKITLQPVLINKSKFRKAAHTSFMQKEEK